MIIITGGAGFIGSCLIAELNSHGINDIVVVDNLGTSSKWKNLANKKISQFHNKANFRTIINTDITNNVHSFHQIEAIVHLGACSDTTQADANYLMDNNFLYSKELLHFALKNKIRFIYASSAATYGDGSAGYSDKSIDNLVPLNCYGFSKHLFDMYLHSSGLENRVTGIKFFNVFGPNEYHKGNMRSMFIKSFEQIQQTGKIQLFKSNESQYADGGQKRDFIYVKDCCKVLMQMLKDSTFTGIYNLGTGKAESWNTLAEAVFNAMEAKINIEYIEMPTILSKQYQNFTEADTDKLLTKLGNNWQFTSIADATKDYIRNYISTKKYL